MVIIFLGTTGVHHALIAANLYIKDTDINLLFLKDSFGDMTKEAMGYPIYIGKDEYGNEVYSLGVGPEIKMAEISIKNLREILGFDESKLLVFPVRIKGEWLVNIVSKLPPVLGLGYIHALVVKWVIRGQIEALNQQIDEVKNEVKQYVSDRV